MQVHSLHVAHEESVSDKLIKLISNGSERLQNTVIPYSVGL